MPILVWQEKSENEEKGQKDGHRRERENHLLGDR